MDTEDQLDSLEDWLVVKEGPFADNMKTAKLAFFVCWNDVKKKVAVTCRLHSRVVSDQDEYQCRSGMFSFREIAAIHELLCHVHPSLGSFLPPLPEEPRSLWTYLGYEENSVDYGPVCSELEEYFKRALEICKEKLLISTLFDFEEHSSEEYFENISELKRQGYEDEIQKAVDELKNVIFLRTNASHMQDMKDVYKAEDQAVFKLNIALAALYNYLLQPFLDVRELAYSNVMEAKELIQNPNVGARVKREYGEMFTEWQGHYEEALDSIQKYYIEYYTRTCNICRDMLSRMEEDKTKFGKTSFELVGAERFHRIQEDSCLEKLQLLNNEKKLYMQERDKVKEEIACLDDKPGAVILLEGLEASVFDWQIKIYQQQMKILDVEEKLARNQMEAITRIIKDQEDIPVFFDAVEDVDELSSDEDIKAQSADPRVVELRNKLTSITRTRAKVRTVKASLERKHKIKASKKREEENQLHQHHAIQKKIEQRKEKINQIQDFVQFERKKAIERIRNHKIKYPAPETIKPPRYQPPSQKKAVTPCESENPQSNCEQTTVIKRPKPLSNSEKTIKMPAKVKKSPKKTSSPGSSKPQPKPRKSKDSVDSGQIPLTDCDPSNKEQPPPPEVVQSPSISPTLPAVPPPPPPPPPPPFLPPPPPPPPPLMPSGDQSTSKIVIIKKNKTENNFKKESESKPNPGNLDLTTILASKNKLKPVSESGQKQKPVSGNPMDSILNIIKQGVKLRPSASREDQKRNVDKLEPPSDQHLRLLQESLNRISHFTRDTSPESDEESDHEFDD